MAVAALKQGVGERDLKLLALLVRIYGHKSWRS